MNETRNTDNVWQIFTTLTKISSSDFRDQRKPELEHDDREACLRRVLRPHDEAGFMGADEEKMVVWRDALDRALSEITLREIRRELDLLWEPLPTRAQEELLLLFHSEAFLRYLNAYHYFGVRFVPFWPQMGLFKEDDPDGPFRLRPRACGDTNVPNSVLAAPPPLTTLPDAERVFEEFGAELASDNRGKVHTALRFLDGFKEEPEIEPVLVDLTKPTAFELWLRGLRPETTEAWEADFRDLAAGITEWAVTRANFYLRRGHPAAISVRNDENPEAKDVNKRPPEGWIASHPATARLALADIYWISRIFRADLSSEGTVSYQKYNWLHLIRFRATFDQEMDRVKELTRAEEALRSVFDYVCDLVQNAVEVTEQCVERLATEKRPANQDGDRPATSVAWRVAFDEELKEIEAERGVRHYRDPTLAPQATTGDIVSAETGLPEGSGTPDPASATAARKEADRINRIASEAADRVDGKHLWSRRLLGSRRPANLIGLAFSGGGIRSATLNLGVLQGLQELDLLRHFDYISTVSGGGFIGSWLIGNVRRSAHWLGRLTDWSASIAHLRKYSNYLAPRTGLLSPDTLNIASTWLRNTLLIQLSALTWLFVVLLSALAAMRTFLWAGGIPWLDSAMLGACSLTVVIALLIYLAALPASAGAGRKRFGQRWVVWCAVLPASIGTTALASRFWAAAPRTAGIWPCLDTSYSYFDMLQQAWKPWLPLLAFSAVAIALLATKTLQRSWGFFFWGITVACIGVLYLELVALFRIFRSWSELGDTGNSVAFVFGPPLALLSSALVILLLIGFSSKNTDEAQREWWTRYGTWLAIYGGVGLFVCGIALFGPKMVLGFFGWFHQKGYHIVPWATLAGWIGTVVGGLFAGKSSQTGGNGESTKSQLLEALAKVAGVLFILGSFLLSATLLYVLLFQLFGPDYAVIVSQPLHVFCEIPGKWIWVTLLATGLVGWAFSARFEINIFGFSQFYRNRLVRCYLGATRWMPGARKPNPFTKFDFRDDIRLWRFRTDSPGEDHPGLRDCDPYRGPFPLLNCSLNLAGSSDLELNTRHGASFTLTPLRCGSSRARVGYAPTYLDKSQKFADGVQLGQAVAVSGAAVSSNMGYNTSSLVAFLLTMFNVRLGWWFPNPGKNRWKSRGLTNSLIYLLAELFGAADEKRDFVNVSDGGHFENLGIYELVRRRSRIIIACDAECDADLQFPSLGKMIRNCKTDFGAEIDLNVDSIRRQANGLSLAHCAVGTIKYCTGEIGYLIYLKASITGDEDVSVAQYHCQHPDFPHESTADQFYSEDQFESYRRLGLEMVRASFKGNLPGDDPILIGERMFDLLTPAALSSDKFLTHTRMLDHLWEHFRCDKTLHSFMNELMSSTSQGLKAAAPSQVSGVPQISEWELAIGLELMQLMEDVFLDLKLDDHWQHPDYRGWAILFMRWARSQRFREIWRRTRRTFGIRFEYFCHANLGLERDHPIARV